MVLPKLPIPEAGNVTMTSTWIPDVDIYKDVFKLPGFLSFIRIKLRIYIMDGDMLAFEAQGHRFFTIDYDSLNKYFFKGGKK